MVVKGLLGGCLVFFGELLQTSGTIDIDRAVSLGKLDVEISERETERLILIAKGVFECLLISYVSMF